MNQAVEQKLYKISEVAKITGASRKALQEYDKMDMIHPTTKTEGGYWLYNDDALMAVSVIQMFSMVGYSRKEIKEFLPTVTGFDHLEERKERFEEAIKRLEEKKAKIEILMSIAKTMKDICSLPKEALQQMHDYKYGGTFAEQSCKEKMEQFADNLAKQDEDVQEQVHEALPLMTPFVGKFMLLACYQEESPTSCVVQEKVAEVFEEWKKGYTPFMRMFGEYSETENIEDKPLSEQLGAFRGYSEITLGGLEPTPLGDTLEMPLNHRYGEGTGDRIREMLDAFVALKSESEQ